MIAERCRVYIISKLGFGFMKILTVVTLTENNFTWFLKPSQSKESQKALTLQELLQLTVTA